MSICVCIICNKPSEVWLNFLAKFKTYEVFMVVDDNSKQYAHDKVNIVQIDTSECELAGFKRLSFNTGKVTAGWEKAVYYFSRKEYDHVWFIEDDVFFDKENVLINIDSTNDADLLCNTVAADPTTWLWKQLTIEFPPPYWHAMVCAVRLSKTLLGLVQQYAKSYGTLFFLEAMFPTLCLRSGLKQASPHEMTYVVYRTDYTDADITTTHLYHPLKNMLKHLHHRRRLALQRWVYFKKTT